MKKDLISREALKKAIDDYASKIEYKAYNEGFKDGVEQGIKLSERPQGEWIDYSEEGFVECPFCHKATTCEDNIDELHYCWNCGAKMKGGAECSQTEK